MADLPSAARGRNGHDEHDPELIAALLDRDLPDADRSLAAVRVAACPACATLHEDLLALAKATLELPTPPRHRDFTLTAEVAAALARMAPEEPVPVGARLTREMNDSRSTHSTHDRLLIASFVDRSVTDDERARAEEQLAACQDCEQLYDDLVALSAATRALPVPSRPRDFTLTPTDAERLRVHGWRRLLAAIGSSRDVFSRPLALGLTTLGLAGLLVATIPNALTGLGGAGTALSTVGGAGDAAGGNGANPEKLAGQAPATPSAGAEIGAAAAPAAASPAASAAAPAPDASVGSGVERQSDNLFVGGESSPLAGEPDSRDLYGKSLSAEREAPSGMAIVAGLLLLAGLGLFALRWTSRRLGAS